MVLESLEEHKQIKTLLREMENLASDSEKFEPKLKVLMENVEHHAEEEEEEKCFPNFVRSWVSSSSKNSGLTSKQRKDSENNAKPANDSARPPTHREGFN